MALTPNCNYGNNTDSSLSYTDETLTTKLFHHFRYMYITGS